MRLFSRLFYGFTFFIFFLCIPTSPVQGQWIYTYGTNTGESVASLKQTADGGYILAGSKASGLDMDSHSDAWLLKLDQNGSIVWQKSYGGTGNYSAAFAEQTEDGSYVVVGSYNAGHDYDIWFLKLDAHGNVLLQKTYGGLSDDYAVSAKSTLDGGFLIAGNTYSFGAGNRDVWILKVDAGGNVEWEKTYGGSGFDSINAFEKISGGGYIAAGGTYSFGTVNQDVWILKLNGNGEVTWSRTIGDVSYDYANSVQQTIDGGFIVAGFTGTNSSAWIIKLDANGTVEWQKRYSEDGRYYAASIRQTQDRGYIVSGTFDPWYGGLSSPWILKLDELGNIQWMKKYGGKSRDDLLSILQEQDGRYVAAGTALSFGAGSQDALVLKLNENGSVTPCPFGDAFNTTAVVTAVEIKNAPVDPGTSSATTQNTTALASLTNAKQGKVCPFTDDILLKVKPTNKRGGEGTIESWEGFLSCPDTCQAWYVQDFPVTLNAIPGGASTFLGWKPKSLNCPGTYPCSVTMDKRKSVKAIFDGPRRLKIVISCKNKGQGNVMVLPAMDTCPDSCEHEFRIGSEVSLTANPKTDSVFLGWKGRDCKNEPTNRCTFIMEKNVKVKAIFEGASQ